MSITRINSLGITDGTIVNGDINASAAIASTKLTGINDAKAWVNFDGTGTPAIRGSFNVTSITDNGIGEYTVNITTALTDTNYAVVASSGSFGSTVDSGRTFATPNIVSTTACEINTKNSNTGTLEDYNQNCLTIFR